jgi:cell division septal protein FtsQ
MMTGDYKRKKIRRTKHFRKKNRLTFNDIVPAIKVGMKAFIAVGVVSAVLVLCGYLFNKLKDSPYFYVNKMVFKGCEKVKGEDLYKLSKVDGNTSIFSLDMKEIAKNISKHPWVKKISVKKQFPNKLNIYVEERRPIAMVNLDNLYYIDEEGVIFKKLEKEDDSDFLVITGLSEDKAFSDDMESKKNILGAISLINMLSQRETFSDKDVSEINLDESVGITLFTYNDAIPIKVGTFFSNKRFDGLERVLEELKKKSIRPERIDIDYDKRIVVKAGA